MDDLRSVALELGYAPSDSSLCALVQWAELVVQWRAAAQLTGLRTGAAIIGELMVPALYALPLLPSGPGFHVVDYGCGSGSSGVALAAVVGHGRWTLVDQDEKKVTFCRYAQARCGIAGVEIATPKEAVSASLACDAALARALPSQGAAIVQAAALLREGGSVLRWVIGENRPLDGPTVQCGASSLWVVSQPRECFT
jgi:16S rRNA G527 N7-methylase RsmG